jgi:hypothetical protein
MDQENTLIINKSRCPKLSGGVFAKPGKELADVLKEWLGGVSPGRIAHEAANMALVASGETNKNGVVKEGSEPQTVVTSTEELGAIWKRMCSPRGVAHEFEVLKASTVALAGSTGLAEFYRILRQHGVSHPRQFRSTQPARLCAKDVYGLLEQLRSNARENLGEVTLPGEGEAVGAETLGQAR